MDVYNFLDDCQMNTLNDLSTTLQENFQQSFSSESHYSYPNITTATLSGTSSVETSHFDQKPAKQSKTTSATWYNPEHVVLPKLATSTSSSSQLLSFGNSNPQPPSKPHQQNYDRHLKPKDETMSHIDIHFSSPLNVTNDILFENQEYYSPKAIHAGAKRNHSMIRTPSHAQDHVIAERKRREKLTQRFIALSALVPGLKKVTTLYNFNPSLPQIYWSYI